MERGNTDDAYGDGTVDGCKRNCVKDRQLQISVNDDFKSPTSLQNAANRPTPSKVAIISQWRSQEFFLGWATK
jgi:hypothetical protein